MKKFSDKFALGGMTAVCLVLGGAATLLHAGGEECKRRAAAGTQVTCDGATACGQTACAAPTGTPIAYNKASGLVGLEVINDLGRPLGRIKDVVVDPQSERVSYAVLATGGGFLGQGKKFLAVPIKAFTPQSDERTLLLNADARSVEQAQGFDPRHWPALGTTAWGAEPFWRQKEPATAASSSLREGEPGTLPDVWEPEHDTDPEMAEPGMDIGENEPSTLPPEMEPAAEPGKAMSEPSSPMGLATLEPTKFNRVHSLMGMKVRSPDQETLGTLKDLVIDLQSERVSYAVLARRASGGTAAKLFAVPLNALRPSADQKSLVLNADKQSLLAGQGFPADQWPSVSHPMWGAEPSESSSGVNPAAATQPMQSDSEPAQPKQKTVPEEYLDWEF